MTDGDAPRLLYLAVLLVLVIGSLVGMRISAAKAAKMALAWIAIFGAAFVLFAFREDFSALGQRLKAEATGTPIASGEELRIPRSDDGHYWVEASLDGHGYRFLVDSGASSTTVSSRAAEEAGLQQDRSDWVLVGTANGEVRMHRAPVSRFAVGPIERTDIRILVNPADSTNVLGMDFLSSLDSWRVERGYLVLRS